MDYPAKIILFGEYGIILNSKALAIPYPHFSGRLCFSDNLKDKLSKMDVESNMALKRLYSYFKETTDQFQFLNLKDFEEDIINGLYFDSSIPSGSGLGSSGALTAAIYNRYANNKDQDDHQMVKNNLATMESCFHGVSSGIDPFISWLRKPLLLENKNSINSSVDLSPFLSTYTLFLINTHSKGNTGILVNRFLEHYEMTDFKEKIDKEYIPVINQTIDTLIAADFDKFDKFLRQYSQFQILHLKEMIPLKMTEYFNHGIESKDFYLKICGSGGGGFILGISRNRKNAESFFNLNHLDYCVV